MNLFLSEDTIATINLCGLIILFFLIYCICRMLQAKRFRFWTRDVITPMSIKESIDNLPAGLLFYYPEGMVKLANKRMENICHMMTGEPLTNGRNFGRLVSDDKTFHTLSDGTAVSFKSWELTIGRKTVYELVAFDVTKEASLNRELDRKKSEASRLNKRLKELSDNIKQMAIESEALDAKIRIHDSLGQILLMAKKAVISPGSIDEEDLKRQWLQNLKMIEAYSGDQINDFLIENLSSLGVNIVIDGELPKEGSLKDILRTAFTVHITNVIQHAEGDTVFVKIRRLGDLSYILEFTNNGKVPAKTAREGGGLNNLRREAGYIGGRLETKFSPVFSMRLYLPVSE